MTDLAQTAAAILLGAHPLPADVAATVRLSTVPGLTGDQGLITIGYDKDGKRKVTAQTLTHDMPGAIAILADRERLAGLLCQGIRAIPAQFRPQVPAWIAESAEAARADAMRARVKTVARTAADKADALPWAA